MGIPGTCRHVVPGAGLWLFGSAGCRGSLLCRCGLRHGVLARIMPVMASTASVSVRPRSRHRECQVPFGALFEQFP